MTERAHIKRHLEIVLANAADMFKVVALGVSRQVDGDEAFLVGQEFR